MFFISHKIETVLIFGSCKSVDRTNFTWPESQEAPYSKTCVKLPLSKRLKIEGTILQYFRPSLCYQSLFFCLFLSGSFTQVLLCLLGGGILACWSNPN